MDITRANLCNWADSRQQRRTKKKKNTQHQNSPYLFTQKKPKAMRLFVVWSIANTITGCAFLLRNKNDRDHQGRSDWIFIQSHIYVY